MTHFVRILPFRALAAGAVLLAFAGCSSTETAEAPVPCPAFRIPDEAAKLTRFRPGGAADLTDVAFQARISGTGMNCLKGDEREAIVDVAIEFEAARGPAATQSGQQIPYFVGIVGPDGQILNKQSFSVELQVPDRQSTAASVEEIRITIPVAEGRTADAYTLFGGLQLTPEELQYNRETR